MIKKSTRPIITIDGPAASGKGTISKKIAKDFNLYNLETGIYYRFIGKEFLDSKHNKDIEKFISSFKKKKIQIDREFKNHLYSERVAEKASELAKLESVRSLILSMQLQTLRTYPKKFKGIILEGRDCGTVIVPKANVKFFLNAKVEIRAKRRYEQLLITNEEVKYESILNDLVKRDENDVTRKHSPLKKADDAMEIDCSFSTIEETIMIVKKIILSKLPNFK